MQQKRFPLLMWLGALCVGALLTACTAVTPVAPAAVTPAPDATSAPQLANPASVNCAEQGGTLTIETRGDGGEFGVCSFEDNLQCEEWALFRGECPAGGVKVTGYATDAARYCAITGGEYQADESTTTASGEEDGTCTLPDGQSCNVWDYYNGTCDAAASASDEASPTSDEASPTSDEASPSDDQAAPAADSDPFAYCASAGTDDMPAGETVDGQLPDAIVQGMIAQDLVSADAPEAIQQAAQWRCMDGNVWVCVVGANLPCGEKADLSDTPTDAMTEFCQANANADAIPASVTGRATVYSWQCDGETPTVIEQLFTADAPGYLAEFWTELTPPQSAETSP